MSLRRDVLCEWDIPLWNQSQWKIYEWERDNDLLTNMFFLCIEFICNVCVWPQRSYLVLKA